MRGKLMLWNWSGKDEPQQLTIVGNPRRSPGIIGAVAFSRDGSQVAVPPDNTTGISLYDVAAGADASYLLAAKRNALVSKGALVLPDGKLLAAPIDDLNYGGGIAAGCRHRSVGPPLERPPRHRKRNRLFVRRPMASRN